MMITAVPSQYEVTVDLKVSSEIRGDPLNYIYFDGGINNSRYKPTRIIYNAPVTICYFEDGSRVVVLAGKHEKFDKETGVMACIMRKMFRTRGEFLRLVESGYEQEA